MAEVYVAMDIKQPQINTALSDYNGNGHVSANQPLSAVSAPNGHGNSNGHANGNGYGNSDSSGTKSSRGFSFLRNFTSDKKLKADGQPPKRRGPKPDSKPALTRRQELNRQAQRTHRERKELYIKALEQEVSRLKEVYGKTCAERDTATEENRQLKELLASKSIPLPDGISSPPPNQVDPLRADASMAPTVGSSPNISTPKSSITLHPPSQPASGISDLRMIDHDQLGVQFVLALEQPCMDHMQMLCAKSQSTDEGVSISGHALMATCPPASHMEERPNEPYPHKMPELPQVDLLKLLDLSARLPLDGEITPVMAWACIMQDERATDLSEEEFETLKAELEAKVRCYGFGAVLEEFEVKDALERLLSLRDGEGAAPVGMAVSTNSIPTLHHLDTNGRS